MFINDVNKREAIRKIAVQTLRKYGIKFRERHQRPILQVSKSTRFFKVHLQNLENETITLKNGQQLVVPKQLYEICTFIFNRVETEGIFRKEGSRSRQHEIKLLLDRGCLLDDHHVIDVAVVLKYFLRELPEPLIPYSFHDLFLRCSLIEKKTEALLLACLLLPVEHLNVLSFIMQFFSEVANHSHYNKMNVPNIATVIGPNIFPINEKIDQKNKVMITRARDIIKIMIDNSVHIGIIPDYIIEQIGGPQVSKQENLDFKPKRRSGSFTRIFHGLKKIVGSRPDEELSRNIVTPDLLRTASFCNATNRQQENTPQKIKGCHRWSSASQAATKRKQRNSLLNLPGNEFNTASETNYEEIKNRVCKIEKELSKELENAKNNLEFTINGIQSAYEQTLVQTEPMSPTADHLARRLSRELRIRTSEQKIIRSPSARKIGNMKRRSRELDRPNGKLFKSNSFQFAETMSYPSTPIENTNLYENVRKSSENLRFNFSEGIKPCVATTNDYLGPKLLRNGSIPALSVDLFEDEDVVYKKRRISAENWPNVALFGTTSHTKQKCVKPKEKSSKQNLSSLKRSLNLKQRRKSDKFPAYSKENVPNFEEGFVNENKLSNKSPMTNVPHIKKSLILKHSKPIIRTPTARNTPMKVLAASQRFDPNVSF